MASEADGPVTIAQVRYLSGLPSDDAAAITGSFVTTDPLEARFTTERAYGRVRGIGARTRLSEGMMLELVDRMRDPDLDEVVVVIDSARAVEDALRLRQILES